MFLRFIIDEEFDNIKNYLNVYHDEDDKLIRTLITASYNYILNYTGLTDEEFLKYSDSLKVALFMLVSQYYDSRGVESSQTKQNNAIDSILNLYRSNLAPEEVNN